MKDWDNDEKDKEYKIDIEDVLDAVKSVAGIKLYGELDNTEEFSGTEAEREAKVQALIAGETTEDEESEDEEENSEDDNDLDDMWKTPRASNEEKQKEEDEEEKGEEGDDEREQEDDAGSIIDDSECATDFDVVKTVKAIEDGEYVSLEDRLLLASVRVHESVYGKERTHNEKMYLQNWFGKSTLFRSWIPIPPPSAASSNATQHSGLLSEEQSIERDKVGDNEYFGYSLYDAGSERTGFWFKELASEDNKEIENSDSEEYSDEETEEDEIGPPKMTVKLKKAFDEDVKLQKLRWMLRTESYRVINEFFENEEDVLLKDMK